MRLLRCMYLLRFEVDVGKGLREDRDCGMEQGGETTTGQKKIATYQMIIHWPYTTLVCVPSLQVLRIRSLKRPTVSSLGYGTLSVLVRNTG